jgi:hypothetical protein
MRRDYRIHFFRDEGTYRIPPPTIYYTRATSPRKCSRITAARHHPSTRISQNSSHCGRRKNSSQPPRHIGAYADVHRTPFHVVFNRMTTLVGKILSHVHRSDLGMKLENTTRSEGTSSQSILQPDPGEFRCRPGISSSPK